MPSRTKAASSQEAPQGIQLDFKERERAEDCWEGTAKNGRSWKVHCGDAKRVLATMPEGIFNCVVTSPPYYSLRDYDVEGQIGLEETVAEYVDAIVSVMDEVKRVTADNGLLFLNLGDTYYSGKGKSHGVDKKSSKRRFGLRPVDKSGGLGLGLKRKSAIGVPWRVALNMSELGWVLRSSIIWHRDKALPEAVRDRPRRSYEYVFMFAKQRHYFFNREALKDVVVEEDVWTIPARPRLTNGIETAPYPDELVERCLQVGCRETAKVLDPFAGAGTTLRVALVSGRDAVGIDVSPLFCEHMATEMRKL